MKALPSSLARALLLASLVGVASPARAHRPSDGFLTIDVEGANLSGQLDLAFRDLDLAFGLDADGDAKITWGEVKDKEPELHAYVAQHLSLSVAGEPCRIAPLDTLVTEHTDGPFAVFLFEADCAGRPVPDLLVRYDVLFDADAQHRGLMKITFGEDEIAHVFTAERRTYLTSIVPDAGQFTAFLREGILHIYRGYDHMLFLVALLLPAVFFRARESWIARDDLKSTLWETAKVVTAFTIAHSLTLAFVTLRWWEPPASRYVEIAVAASILFTALNNVRPFVAERRWLVGFVFGLIHGTGYASVLTDLGLQSGALVKALLGFNLGVEVAQLVVIALVLPLAFALRKTLFYKRWVLVGGSLAVGLFAIGWMVEQGFDVAFMPF